MTIHTTGAVPDLFSEEVGSDPFSAYAELRALGPVYDEQNDPSETVSLHDQPEHKALLETLAPGRRGGINSHSGLGGRR